MTHLTGVSGNMVILGQQALLGGVVAEAAGQITDMPQRVPPGGDKARAAPISVRDGPESPQQDDGASTRVPQRL